jgi:hypothetical protein
MRAIPPSLCITRRLCFITADYLVSLNNYCQEFKPKKYLDWEAYVTGPNNACTHTVTALSKHMSKKK